MSLAATDDLLREFVIAISAGDHDAFDRLLEDNQEVAKTSLKTGGSRENAQEFFFDNIGYVYAGDTALHAAAAAYRVEMVEALLQAGADPSARNRRGCEPLHSASSGHPGSESWNPEAQAVTIECLIKRGANPNAQNMDGATPLHRAVRTRCAQAVETLMRLGADPRIKNQRGNTPVDLVTHASGRGGSGTAAYKVQRDRIAQILR